LEPTFFFVGFPRAPEARCGNHSSKKLDQKDRQRAAHGRSPPENRSLRSRMLATAQTKTLSFGAGVLFLN
jgi:hypothetical protein